MIQHDSSICSVIIAGMKKLAAFAQSRVDNSARNGQHHTLHVASDLKPEMLQLHLEPFLSLLKIARNPNLRRARARTGETSR